MDWIHNQRRKINVEKGVTQKSCRAKKTYMFYVLNANGMEYIGCTVVHFICKSISYKIYTTHDDV